jgi:arginine N-succinyltransferase
MLERECFKWDGYVDIFDGGPTVTSATDNIRTVEEAREVKVSATAAEGGQTMLLATGRLHEFRACYAEVQDNEDGTVAIDATARKLLGVETGETILIAGR